MLKIKFCRNRIFCFIVSKSVPIFLMQVENFVSSQKIGKTEKGATI